MVPLVVLFEYSKIIMFKNLFQIRKEEFFYLCKYIRIHGCMYGKIFTIGGIFEKAATIDNTASRSSSVS